MFAAELSRSPAAPTTNLKFMLIFYSPYCTVYTCVYTVHIVYIQNNT
jgi:hypothetical protein